jgi:hypothetical protein
MFLLLKIIVISKLEIHQEFLLELYYQQALFKQNLPDDIIYSMCKNILLIALLSIQVLPSCEWF